MAAHRLVQILRSELLLQGKHPIEGEDLEVIVVGRQPQGPPEFRAPGIKDDEPGAYVEEHTPNAISCRDRASSFPINGT